jgi:hypothetical protein
LKSTQKQHLIAINSANTILITEKISNCQPNPKRLLKENLREIPAFEVSIAFLMKGNQRLSLWHGVCFRSDSPYNESGCTQEEKSNKVTRKEFLETEK